MRDAFPYPSSLVSTPRPNPFGGFGLRDQVRSRGPQVRIESGVFRLVRDLGGGALPAVLETVAVAVHLQDVNVVGEPVKQSAGEPLGVEHLGPLVEGQVGGDRMEPRS